MSNRDPDHGDSPEVVDVNARFPEADIEEFIFLAAMIEKCSPAQIAHILAMAGEEDATLEDVRRFRSTISEGIAAHPRSEWLRAQIEIAKKKLED